MWLNPEMVIDGKPFRCTEEEGLAHSEPAPLYDIRSQLCAGRLS